MIPRSIRRLGRLPARTWPTRSTAPPGVLAQHFRAGWRELLRAERAKLLARVAVLNAALGVAARNAAPLSGAIEFVLGEAGSASAAEVRDMLGSMGLAVSRDTVDSLINRLVAAGTLAEAMRTDGGRIRLYRVEGEDRK